jgi:rhodanese-related sulfurtransferase/effector-binding domain-containing protein
MKLHTLLSALLLTTTVLAADKPAEAPKALIGEPHEQTLGKEQTYLFSSTETTFGNLEQTIGAALPKVREAIKANKVDVAGSMVFIYHNADPTGAKPFTLDIGFIVADDTKVVADLKVRKLEPIRCDTILMTGPISSISQAYEKLMPAVFMKQHEPTGEVREAYLYWEGKESANNVLQIQVAVKKPQPAAAQPGASKIAPAEFEKLAAEKGNVILDVRTPKEFAEGHLAGAVNIDYKAKDFQEKLAGLHNEKTYLVYCAIGGRSTAACEKLDKLNFTHLYNLDGGIMRWQREGKKVEKE